MGTIVELRSYEDICAYLSNPKNSLIILEFYDNSNGTGKLLSSRLQSKLNCADIKVTLLRIDTIILVELAAFYKITKTPTIIAIHKNGMVQRLEGPLNDKQLDNILKIKV